MSHAHALRVLIADDAPAIADMLKELLSDPGNVEVVGVSASQESAITDIARLKPDVVVLDLQLKSGSGTEVIRAVRASGNPVRIIVLSNHTSPQLRAGCLDLGADAFLDKVKELGTLADEIARCAAAPRA
jgi:DNA-binding NarL/FixJ family response regulator